MVRNRISGTDQMLLKRFLTPTNTNLDRQPFKWQMEADPDEK